MDAILAHESWFTRARPPYDWSFATEPATLALVAAAISVAVVWRIVGRRLPRPELPFLAPIGRAASWVPRLLAIHAGVSLLAQAARGTYLAPSLELGDTPAGSALAIVEGSLGVWLDRAGTGSARPRSSWWPPVRWGCSPSASCRSSSGWISSGSRCSWRCCRPARIGGAPRRPSPTAWRRPPSRSARWWGARSIVLAVTEKLARPELALAFLDRFPAFNLLDTIGLQVSDLTFVRIAGAFELLFGLLILSGTLPQVVVIAAGIPFNATLFFLGTEELIGHLPIYGAMLALLIYGSNRELAPVVDLFPRRARDVVPPAEPASRPVVRA